MCHSIGRASIIQGSLQTKYEIKAIFIFSVLACWNEDDSWWNPTGALPFVWKKPPNGTVKPVSTNRMKRDDCVSFDRNWTFQWKGKGST